MPPKEDLTGQRFARLVILRLHPEKRGKRRAYECRCDCGETIVVVGESLKSTNTRSCGCIRREQVAARNRTHGQSSRRLGEHPLYNTWVNMRKRCTNPKDKRYHRYGGRGITVCKRWSGRNGFPNFVADMGERPTTKHSLDRIDNDGNYERDNCRWATMREQALNSFHPHCRLTFEDVASIRRLLADGELQKDIAARFGVTPSYISQFKRDPTLRSR